MSSLLLERLEQERAQAENVPVEFDLAPEALVDWSEGVEHLQRKTPSELYEMLGLKEPSIPYFNEYISDQEGSGGTKELFSLRWHQLVGVTKMMERAMTSQPVLLMDDVGLGKTVQVLAFFAMLAYYRAYYDQNKRYPGAWGKRFALDCEFRQSELTRAKGKQGDWTDYGGTKNTLPNNPFLIVVPPTLVEQVTQECNRFLQPGSLDVIKVTGSAEQHEQLWAQAGNLSNLEPGRRLYVASTTVSVNS
jgi:SNF2 family DNA or RNA helicase